MFGLDLRRWRGEKGHLRQISLAESLPHLRLLECLSSLPKPLRSISLKLPYVEPGLYESPENITTEFLKALDSAIGSPKYSQLTCVELLWCMRLREPRAFVDHLYDRFERGHFAQCMPIIYRRRILWCGDGLTTDFRVFPIQPSVAIRRVMSTTPDRMTWVDSARPRLFHRLQ